MWTISKVFSELVTILFLFCVCVCVCFGCGIFAPLRVLEMGSGDVIESKLVALTA